MYATYIICFPLSSMPVSSAFGYCVCKASDLLDNYCSKLTSFLARSVHQPFRFTFTSYKQKCCFCRSIIRTRNYVIHQTVCTLQTNVFIPHIHESITPEIGATEQKRFFIFDFIFLSLFLSLSFFLNEKSV
jgi:hypothetical protein